VWEQRAWQRRSDQRYFEMVRKPHLLYIDFTPMLSQMCVVASLGQIDEIQIIITIFNSKLLNPIEFGFSCWVTEKLLMQAAKCILLSYGRLCVVVRQKHREKASVVRKRTLTAKSPKC
jgi:hypothetical protein